MKIRQKINYVCLTMTLFLYNHINWMEYKNYNLPRSFIIAIGVIEINHCCNITMDKEKNIGKTNVLNRN
jgi:hypothetical protein